jgi:hypothetical protein
MDKILSNGWMHIQMCKINYHKVVVFSTCLNLMHHDGQLENTCDEICNIWWFVGFRLGESMLKWTIQLWIGE